MLGNLRGLGLRCTGGEGCLHCHVGSMQVTCHTCHAGRTNPTPLPGALASHYDSAGIDATVTRYDKLRDRYYEGDVYDFREGGLIRIAAELTEREAHDDALRILD